MRREYVFMILAMLTNVCVGQTDTIFSNNEKISCFVVEILPDAVKYKYEGEDFVNTKYKNSIEKIIFKSGRVEHFSEASSLRAVNSAEDYENVTITQVESEVRGLFKIGEVSSKAKGTTTMSNQERVKGRAYDKMKMMAAMMGANIIYLTNQRTEGNKMGGYYQSGSSAETNLSGIAYTNRIPSIEDFMKLLQRKSNFTAVEETRMWSSSTDYTISDINDDFIIKEIVNENGLIMIKGHFEGETNINLYRVVSFDNEYYRIFYKGKSVMYNFKLRF